MFLLIGGGGGGGGGGVVFFSPSFPLSSSFCNNNFETKLLIYHRDDHIIINLSSHFWNHKTIQIFYKYLEQCFSLFYYQGKGFQFSRFNNFRKTHREMCSLAANKN